MTKENRQDLSSLRVALVHYWLVGMRGGEKVLEALCRMFPQADIYTHVLCPEQLSACLLKQRIQTTFIQKLPWSARAYQRYLPLMPLALEQLDLRHYDLVISSESGPAKGVITRTDTAHLCYCHSPMRYLWDFYHDYLENAGLLTKLCMRPFFHQLRLWDFASAQRPDHIIANSTTVAKRVRRWWRREAEVVHPPVDCQRFIQADTHVLQTLQEPLKPYEYYLILSELVPYKRVDLAVQACTTMQRPLVVVGDGSERQRLEHIAGPTVRFLGRIDYDLIPALFASCKAFLFPGEEDFGITPVEAMAAGRPVLAYGRGGVCDSVVPEHTGLFFQKQTADALIEILYDFEQRLETNKNIFPVERLQQHALRFSEEHFSQKMRSEIQTTLQTVRACK